VGLTNYERSLRARLRNPSHWPDFTSAEFLQRLESAAIRALRKRSVEGPLAAILIYHQLVEEILRLLVQDSRFLTQAALRPWRIEFPSRTRQMFGQLQQDLQHAVAFQQKSRLLALSERLNRIRIDVVHRLTQRGSLAGLTRDARRARRLYERIFDIFVSVHDDFRVGLNGFRKDL